MKKLETLKQLLKRDYTPLEKLLLLSNVFFIGIFVGFYLSPIKQGFRIFSKNVNQGD